MAKTADNGTSKGLGLHARRIIAYIVLIFITFLCLFWFYILFINATRSNSQLKRGFTPIPSNYLIINFQSMLHGTQPILRGMLNSIIISTGASVLGAYFSTMTAYAIHTYEFKLRKFMFTFILAIMTIPTQVMALGFIKMMITWGLEDSYIPLIVPAIAAPVTFFYMKQYMDSTLPLSLIEAARIDGAGEMRIFNTIALPLMKPALAVQFIFSFVGCWNNYFTPALLLHKNDMKTLPILIAELRSADFLKFDMGVVYVTIAFAIFPVIVMYLILSKNIVGGMTTGGVKG